MTANIRERDGSPLWLGMGLTYAFDDGDVLFSELDLSLHRGRYGLVGDNGVGKSTLLRIIAGELAASRGRIESVARIAYLSQDFVPAPDATVGALLGLGAKMEAKARIEAGSLDPHFYDLLGDDWDLQGEVDRLLRRVGLPSLPLERSLHTLSGGELTRARLAALLSLEPELLLLDEPSNHLDAGARAALQEVVATWPSGLVVASHDRRLLAEVDMILELRRGGLQMYGGDYAAYAEMRATEDAATRASAEAAKLALERTRRQAVQSRERQEQRSAAARRRVPSLGLPKFLLGARKRKAQATAGRLGKVHERRIEHASETLQEAKARVADDEHIVLDLDATQIAERKPVVSLRDFKVVFGAPLWREPLNVEVCGPRRIGLKGDNGVGKSVLLKALAGLSPPNRSSPDRSPAVTSGEARVLLGPVAYLDQSLAFLRNDLTVIENYRLHAAALTETMRRIRLGRMLFESEQMSLPVASLSGGERMRLALACALLGDEPARLLLLDEPTNHLDVSSMSQLEGALERFRGALIVVAHDAEFLDGLGLDTIWNLSAAGLKQS